LSESANIRQRSKHVHLLQDANVRRWYENIHRNSPAAAEIYLRNLGKFCETNHLTPHRLASKRPSTIENLLMDHVSAVEGSHAGSYIHNTIKIVKSWLAHNGIELKRKINITAAHETPALKDERVPTRDELKRILLSASKQARTASILVAHSGLRPETIGNYTGADGLTLHDLPDLRINPSEVTFDKIPAMILVRSNLSKARHQYSFLSEEGCGYLKDYLEEHLRNGENLMASQRLLCRSLLRNRSYARSTSAT
jgi:hypothetical protein